MIVSVAPAVDRDYVSCPNIRRVAAANWAGGVSNSGSHTLHVAPFTGLSKLPKR